MLSCLPRSAFRCSISSSASMIRVHYKTPPTRAAHSDATSDGRQSAEQAVEAVRAYHHESKHNFNAYAPGPGGLDWKNQPNPFRTFDGARTVQLELPGPGASYEDRAGSTHCTYNDMFRTAKPFESAPVNPSTISQLLYYSMSISAWKQFGTSAWSLRVNPSSGNLHPTEAYVILPQLQDGHKSVFRSPVLAHYTSKTHALEVRSELSTGAWEALSTGLHGRSFFVALTSIHWRESWKYGLRAFRYCQHDVGHALAAIRLAASMLGWSASVVEGPSTAQLASLLGINRSAEFPVPEELEEPELLIAIVPSATPPSVHYQLTAATVDMVQHGVWNGRANRLSARHPIWEGIDTVASLTRKLVAGASDLFGLRDHHTALESLFADSRELLAAQIVRQRRSAVDMDGRTAITRTQFYAMLSRTVPSQSAVPWDAWPYPVMVHLGIFVHRIQGLDPGLYVLVRDISSMDDLKSHLLNHSVPFSWQPAPGAPDGLHLYVLHKQDLRQVSQAASCNQEIASAGAFSLGMLSHFLPTLQRDGPHMYRRLFWETGMIGQVLYLEAEAHGVRATGIGCFFDDPFHSILGVDNDVYQSLYHFTIGGPVEDTRLQTLTTYEARETNRFDDDEQ
eukprot:TRINITY_DN11157_c0_g1_i2.p1 TRINITY_DN11157_c0_g1~~TRINITY_DN11157_c0_g1_i2.p1  ORF type:complete len:651 (+),score=95.62 TRINITY_DN11157_c0_g1_i2:89-1954(+)